ncbi:gamma-glutamyl-gamma-aminobutyrate hydrolase family protein [Sphingomonas sp. R-74633]|uniref:gamma-glutamyl-gamma-aminobutyrate hydrolase family protein n=1 Tax=Sphingomonas sp. R-74633 TaxID=2751188 RepID=UPI0015D2E195|nr:gamma-glutamyl-gamma-aminobutyrate hydrolase family protein [Sphingomonas sp. R-74633]NYT41086.1 gamma-glutamyl-gamma-aminobutyrate hydrolase family protein [Sphingomonas sp. R-74633]
MKPLIGVLCCNEVAERPIQVVASRFIAPLTKVSDATVLLVPALADAFDARSIAGRLDGLLLTGSRSNIAASRYGGAWDQTPLDEQRDEVALALADAMIEAGRPVFGICRGMQELNVLFGGTLRGDLEGHHLEDESRPFECLFTHGHDVELQGAGVLAAATGARRLAVNSVHRQGIDRLGVGLDVEALSPEDGLVEGFSARPNGAQVLAVQWHPEWDVERQAGSRAFFRLVGEALAA